MAAAWGECSERHPDTVPLPATKCVGYEMPLFLGGEDSLDNMEVSDWEVYWTVVGRLKLRSAGLPDGTPIRDIDASPGATPPWAAGRAYSSGVSTVSGRAWR